MRDNSKMVDTRMNIKREEENTELEKQRIVIEIKTDTITNTDYTILHNYFGYYT